MMIDKLNILATNFNLLEEKFLSNIQDNIFGENYDSSLAKFIAKSEYLQNSLINLKSIEAILKANEINNRVTSLKIELAQKRSIKSDSCSPSLVLFSSFKYFRNNITISFSIDPIAAQIRQNANALIKKNPALFKDLLTVTSIATIIVWLRTYGGATDMISVAELISKLKGFSVKYCGNNKFDIPEILKKELLKPIEVFKEKLRLDKELEMLQDFQNKIAHPVKVPQFDSMDVEPVLSDIYEEFCLPGYRRYDCWHELKFQYTLHRLKQFQATETTIVNYNQIIRDPSKKLWFKSLKDLPDVSNHVKANFSKDLIKIQFEALPNEQERITNYQIEDWLTMIQQSSDYLSDPGLINKRISYVINCIRSMREHKNYSDIVASIFQNISQLACSDSAITILDDIELAVFICKNKYNIEVLVSLALVDYKRSIIRSNFIDFKAKDADYLEAGLYYLINLDPIMELANQHRGMAYAHAGTLARRYDLVETISKFFEAFTVDNITRFIALNGAIQSAISRFYSNEYKEITEELALFDSDDPGYEDKARNIEGKLNHFFYEKSFILLKNLGYFLERSNINYKVLIGFSIDLNNTL